MIVMVGAAQRAGRGRPGQRRPLPIRREDRGPVRKQIDKQIN